MCLGIPGCIVEISDPTRQRGIAEVSGVRRQIHIGLLAGDEGGIDVGDWVLIHVGFAMSKIDAEEADRMLSFLHELGGAYDDELDQFRESAAGR